MLVISMTSRWCCCCYNRGVHAAKPRGKLPCRRFADDTAAEFLVYNIHIHLVLLRSRLDAAMLHDICLTIPLGQPAAHRLAAAMRPRANVQAYNPASAPTETGPLTWRTIKICCAPPTTTHASLVGCPPLPCHRRTYAVSFKTCPP